MCEIDRYEFEYEIASWSDERLLEEIKANGMAYDNWLSNIKHDYNTILDIDFKDSCFFDELIRRFSAVVKNKMRK